MNRSLALALALGLSISCGAAEPSAAQPTASNATAHGEAPEPEPPPWDRLVGEGAVFSAITPGNVCMPNESNRVLVVGEDGAGRRALAERAGCRVSALDTTAELGLCCPIALAAPPAERSGSAKPCEEALREYLASFDGESPKGEAPNLEAKSYAALLNKGNYLNACGVPASAGVSICAAVQGGVAVGITVRVVPASAQLGDCIAAAVKAMSFPSHPQMDVARTTFAPVDG